MYQPSVGGKVRSNKVVVYLRVSTEEQVDNYSLDTQEEICRKEAERRGLEVVKVFREEGRSAKTIKDRPTLIEMLEYCRKNRREIGGVIIYRLDRLSRQTADYLAIRKKLAEAEISLISATEPTGNTPTEKFIETMLAGFAQMDNDVRSERTKNGMRARFLSGLPGGGAPLGYVMQNGYATKDPEKYDLVRHGWEVMATGTKSLRAMAEYLNSKGLRQQRKGGKEYLLRSQTMSEIFRNKFYCGKIVSKKYGEEVQGQHTPMITEEMFYQVQAIIDGRNRNMPPGMSRKNPDNPDFPLRRIIKCSRCGCAFTAAWSKGKKKRYAYYFCRNRCGKGISIPAETIHNEAQKMLKNMSLLPKTITLFNAYLRRTYYQRSSSLQKKRERADEELKKLYALRQGLVEKNLAGVYTDDVFKEQNRIIEEKIKIVQIAKCDSIIEKYNLQAITEFVSDKFPDLAKTVEEADPEPKKTLLCSIFPSGMRWSYPGYSNTPKSPFFQAIQQLQNNNAVFGAPGENRTPDHDVRTVLLYPLSYGGISPGGQRNDTFRSIR